MDIVKVLLVGAPRRGKSVFLYNLLHNPDFQHGNDIITEEEKQELDKYRLLEDEEEVDRLAAYHPTIGANVKHIKINGRIIALWDIAGNDRLAGLRDGYFIGAHVALVFCIQQDYAKLTRDVVRAAGAIPMLRIENYPESIQPLLELLERVQ